MLSGWCVCVFCTLLEMSLHVIYTAHTYQFVCRAIFTTYVVYVAKQISTANVLVCVCVRNSCIIRIIIASLLHKTRCLCWHMCTIYVWARCAIGFVYSTSISNRFDLSRWEKRT